MLKSDKDTFQKLDAEALGHSVYDLPVSLQEKFNVEERLLEYALELDKAYIPTRYPNAHPSMSPRRRYTRVEAERLIGYAEVIFNFCKNLLSKI
jgi:HEPN domain-containing protein